LEGEGKIRSGSTFRRGGVCEKREILFSVGLDGEELVGGIFFAVQLGSEEELVRGILFAVGLDGEGELMREKTFLVLLGCGEEFVNH
jgi:hypothetical protein